ncbi:hypothetical protein CVT24_006998 [Panaeolus cyanescens]|uniref:Uncharacterized protein n=1 Tax=Panaeolus cyanescens TaxID=181874 RepID=A0A409YKE0_9AGAR|nr:hypothetical protein CVT24_006998 [Panaeolus cyanescens]
MAFQNFQVQNSNHQWSYVSSSEGSVDWSLACLGLFAVQIYQFLREATFSNIDQRLQLGLVVTYGYLTLLTFVAVGAGRWASITRTHSVLILLVAFGVYVQRDIVPWMTYTLQPLDTNEGPLLLVKLILLMIAAIIVPLFVPRLYVPLDPQNPMKVTNPEQTASIFSLALYTFLDPIIVDASKVSHLPFEKLPPLLDREYAAHLKQISFPYLDQFRAKTKRHLFWGLMIVFSREFAQMAVCLVILSTSRFVSPLALNRILDFMETGDTSGRIMSPWFWVGCLFFGPIIGSVAWQWYTFIGTRAFARTQAILTQLIFEHSLRIRLKAETNTSEKGLPASADSGPDSDVDAESAEVAGSEDGHSENTAVSKGKAKAEVGEDKSSTKKDNMVGRINTLVSVDVDTITEAKDFLMLAIQAPLEITLAGIFLYSILGWSAFVGFASIVIMLPVPGYIGSLIRKTQSEKMSKTEARVEAVTETLGVLRMVKLFGWEKKMSDNIREKREEELALVKRRNVYELIISIINNLIPAFTMVVTYATYTLIMKKNLSASIVFTSMAVFDRIREKLQWSSTVFAQTITGKVSLERVQDFLRNTDLLDEFDDKALEQNRASEAQLDQDQRNTVIGFKDAVFTWDVPNGQETPSSKMFRLQINDVLFFKKNCINLVVGPTGAGKSSLLMALLGEMHFNPTSVDSWFNLPRSGGVAYAAQESWVQNETIRDNILFGAPYDEERYNKVIYQCALTRDLELFEAGDLTEVGEKGLTLSGGQKARVTLARALYSSAQIILLDDVLAALDIHTSQWIVKECLQGDLIRGRTVILVTHNVALAAPIASFFVAIDINGVVKEAGTSFSSVLASVPALGQELEAEKDASEDPQKEAGTSSVDDSQDAERKAAGKLIAAEEIQEGHIPWKTMMMYLRMMGGKRPVLFIVFWIVIMFNAPAAESFSVWFLGYWSSQYEDKSPQDVNIAFFLSLYVLSLVVMQVFYGISDFYYLLGKIRAGRHINNTLIESVLTSTLRWLDETPASRILARCTQDVGVVDRELSGDFYNTVFLIMIMIVKLIGPVLFTPLFLIPCLLVGILGMYTGNMYLKAQLSVKREMSNARSPVLANFGAAIAGLTSIRAYGAQETFKDQSLARIDHYTRICKTSYNLNRWIAIRLDVMGNGFTACLAAYLLARRSLSASNTGFSLVQSLEFCQFIIWIVQSYNELEVNTNSLERIQAYINIEHEPKPTESGKPPAAWPTSGQLHVDKLYAKYSQNGPQVLKDVSFRVESGERVGIVGRTGSGKSSLTLALLRCILVEGNVLYDGLPIDKINLDALRTSITIIPQVPELLRGTLRRNLDPFNQHDDAVLNNALRDSGLFALQSEMDDGRLTLDTEIGSGGGNLSVGQRQIIALARAIVRNSKLLILDEATSAIDHKTDSIIQSTLRTRLPSDVSVLTVAHRLQTIMDSDKIVSILLFLYGFSKLIAKFI